MFFSKWYKHLIFQIADPEILAFFISVSEMQPCYRGDRASVCAAGICPFPHLHLQAAINGYLTVPCCCTCSTSAIPSCYSCWEDKARAHGNTTSYLILLRQLKWTCSYRFLSAICSSWIPLRRNMLWNCSKFRFSG